MSHHVKIKVYQNPLYRKSGLKSYGYLLRKCMCSYNNAKGIIGSVCAKRLEDNFAPTLGGPFVFESRVHHQGKYGHGGLHETGHHEGAAVGGRTTTQRVLLKKDPSSGTTGEYVYRLCFNVTLWN